MRRNIVFCARHAGGVSRVTGTGGKPFTAVDDPLAPLENRTGLKLRRQSTSADLLGMAECPQILSLGFVHESAQHLASARTHLVGEQLLLQWLDFPLDEVEHFGAQRFDVLRNRQIQHDGFLPPRNRMSGMGSYEVPGALSKQLLQRARASGPILLSPPFPGPQAKRRPEQTRHPMAMANPASLHG